MKESVVRSKSFSFALRIIKLGDYLREQRDYILGDQVVRSGTSIGANIVEADAAISRKEFIAKMAIAHKEARETAYWLALLKESEKLEEKLATSFLNDCEELCKILSLIIKSSKENS
jgi:four helix bundle protein